MAKKKKILFWTEGDSAIGLGLVVRMLTLARKLKKRFSISFVVNKNKHAIAMIRKAGFPVTIFPAVDTIKGKKTFLKKVSPKVIVTDIKQPTAGFFNAIKGTIDTGIVTFDELNGVKLCSDIVINYNTFDPKRKFRSDLDHTRYYFGPAYAILRDEFRKIRKKGLQKKCRKVFTAFGGSDKLGNTQKVVRALSQIEEPLEITCVLGAAFPHEKDLKKAVADCRHKITVYQNIKNISQHINKSDLVITAGGTIMYESIFLGKPVITVCLAPHQQEFATQLHRQGAIINLGIGSKVSERRVANTAKRLMNNFRQRQKLTKKGRGIIDGKGAGRIISLISDLTAS